MNVLIPLQRLAASDLPKAGGKAVALARMMQAGLCVPDGVAVATAAYDQYVSDTGLRSRVLLELGRKRFEDMRWEEMWDAALRIRNLFLTTPLPAALRDDLSQGLAARFGTTPVVVRSSAPSEDTAATSFAGLHESYVNVVGADAILDHISLVWASLWSDRALLYRQELGLDVQQSTMAVVVQELVAGERSGVAFSRSPTDPAQAVVEAVHGLNEGMVDGTVEPDRWVLDRQTGRVLTHRPAEREKAVVPCGQGTRLEPLAPPQRAEPPLAETEVGTVFGLARRAEGHFGAPQDVEWTYRGERLSLLQSRAITTDVGDDEDGRRWYLSLTRSFENLTQLRQRIEGELLPAMDAEAAEMAEQDLATLTDDALADEIERRRAIHQKWHDVYWSDFIPFAHGARLFGQVYNDTVRPTDPFEFTRLLAATEMTSLARNRELGRLAAMLRSDPALAQTLAADAAADAGGPFEATLSDFLARYSVMPAGQSGEREGVVRLLCEMAAHPPTAERGHEADGADLRTSFLAHFEGAERQQAEDLLDLGRASYRLRDNDNIHLQAVEDEWLRAASEGKRRLAASGNAEGKVRLADVLREDEAATDDTAAQPDAEAHTAKSRQILGQPAGPGVATGAARVLEGPDNLFDVQAGEIVVCDAIDPNMTFVVPLSAGIVERRGGMLIHGAIIAREYGLPCVTGVPDATTRIHTGDTVTVDGYLGIVTVAS